MRKKPIKISSEFKLGLDEMKGSSETYEDVLKRIIPHKFVMNWWGKGGGKK